jgi:hypothetical protein
MLPKAMTPEDRTANDMALLKRQQMFPKSRKSKAEDVAPIKATRPLKILSASESTEQEVAFKMTKFTDQGWVSENIKAAPVEEVSEPKFQPSTEAIEAMARGCEDDTTDDANSCDGEAK